MLVNDTTEPLRYALNAGELASLDVVLYHDGQLVPGLPHGGPPPPDSVPDPNVKELPAGRAVELRHTLRHGKLEPGLYKAYLKYEVYGGSVAETKWRLTPVKLEQTIYVVVPE